MTWKLSEAKKNLSGLIDKSITEGPQMITRNGVEVAVVMSVDDYQDLLSHLENSN